ncbi:MAG: hypothetical protein KGI27_15670, partial [Thaumarchaeota archaeon]|nr:hypothetical protein [Nitrososphaerota archaeon]
MKTRHIVTILIAALAVGMGVYAINSGPKAGFFRMLISYPGIQLAIRYDNNSNFVQSDFPWLAQSFYCGIGHNFHITGTSGIGVKYIPYD